MEHLYVTAETVCLVSTPTQVNAFRAVGLANVLTAVAGVGDEVDADHGCQCCPPRGVPMLAHDGLQLRVFENEPIESRERHWRSEEHTSELQSRGHLVCRLLLEKKKKIG